MLGDPRGIDRPRCEGSFESRMYFALYITVLTASKDQYTVETSEQFQHDVSILDYLTTLMKLRFASVKSHHSTPNAFKLKAAFSTHHTNPSSISVRGFNTRTWFGPGSSWTCASCQGQPLVIHTDRMSRGFANICINPSMSNPFVQSTGNPSCLCTRLLILSFSPLQF